MKGNGEHEPYSQEKNAVFGNCFLVTQMLELTRKNSQATITNNTYL